ncbi:MAG TPA: WYL domain-containing protein, partial [Nocardioides sp.]|uniref:WYL domain-containing protein n=1 Tax=Nocardioides sp. TaxID=35761 RepID=UPI002C158402
DVLLPRLRELGAAPVVEAADGSVRVARPDLLRSRTPRQRRPPALDEAREAAHLAAVVHAVRAGDRAAEARPAPAVGSPADALADLREAVESGRTVWIGYVDAHGSVTERIVDPLAVEGGQLHAWDHRGEDRRTFAVHRITGVRAVDP